MMDDILVTDPVTITEPIETSWLQDEKLSMQLESELIPVRDELDLNNRKSQSEEPQSNDLEELGLSQRSKTQISQLTGQVLVPWKEPWNAEPLSLILEALEKAWLNDDYISQVIKEGIESAVFQGPKGEILRDRNNINKLIDKYFRLKKAYKQDINILVVNKFNNPGQLY